MEVEFEDIIEAVVFKQDAMFEKLKDYDSFHTDVIELDRQRMETQVRGCVDVPELVKVIVELGYDLNEAYEYIINAVVEDYKEIKLVKWLR